MPHTSPPHHPNHIDQTIGACFSVTSASHPAAMAATAEAPAAVSKEVVKAWLPMYKPLEKPRLRILCFPSAGSAENIYTGLAVREKERTPNKLMAWATDAQAEVLAVQYPGREQRRKEAFAKSCQAMAAALLPVVEAKLQEEDVPYVIVAHSCGNWIAYELLRLLRARNMPMPKMLFVSCMASPDIAASAKPWKPNKEMSVAQLQAECRLWDVNEVVFRPDVWPTFEPLFRADFSLFDQYTHGPEAFRPFDYPIHGYFAAKDRKISREMVEGWRKFTTSDFYMELVQGNHLFVYNADVRDSWFESITDLLTGEGF